MNLTAERMSGTAFRAPLRQRIGTIIEEIEGFSDAAEEGRSAPMEAIDLLKRTGFFRHLVPARYGGDEGELPDWLHAARRLSSADVSIGWTASVLAIHVLGVTSFDKRLQDEIWNESPDTLISSSVSPVGKAELRDDGIVLTGRYSFSSGCDHAEWALVGVKVPDREGRLAHHLAAIPRSDFTIDDNWRTVGMRGTGSKDLVFDGVFVPRYRIQGLGAGSEPGCPGLHANGMYALPFWTVFPLLFAPVIVGGTEGAIEAFTTQQKKRVRVNTGRDASQSAPLAMRIAESTLDMRAMVALLEKHWEELADYARRGVDVPEDQVIEWRCEDGWVGRVCVKAVERLMQSAGSSAQFSHQRFQRYWRDIHTAGSHVYLDTDAALQILGRKILGLPADEGLR